MSEICEECGMPVHESKNCLQVLRSFSEELENKLEIQARKIDFFLENSTNLRNKPQNHDNYKFIVHDQACCDGCYDLPLIGTRFKCKKCPNLDLCYKCRYTIPHSHDEFYEITTEKLHYNKNCTSCFGKIADVIHKCIVCPQEMCHECFIVNGHEHDQVLDILPFSIKAEIVTNKKSPKCKNGDEILIQIIIYNLSKQMIYKVNVTEEDCPFKVIKKEMEVNLEEKGIVVLEIGGVVQAVPRVYNTKFRIVEKHINETIGPELNLTFNVSDGSFFGLFKS